MKNVKLVLGNATADLSNKFYSGLGSKVHAEKSNEGKLLDFSWIDHMEEAIHYIDNIYMNPKRFIISDEEVLNIEKSKKITVESIKHLAKHSNFISEYDEETNKVKPSKILNVLKEETFDMYENRFIYTLTDFMLSFIERIERINKDLEYQKNNKLKYDGISTFGGEKIIGNIELSSLETINYNNTDNDIKKRIDVIKGSISTWKQSDLYKNLHKLRVPKVTHPIKRTNVILKNPNFQIAVKLWDYLYNYKIVEEKLDKQPEVNEVLPPDLQKIADNSFFIYYLIMKYVNSTSQSAREEYREYVKKATMQLFGDSSNLSLEKIGNTNSNQNLSNNTSQKYSEIKIRKEADSSVIENKIRHNIKDYLDKIEGSYFKLVGGGK